MAAAVVELAGLARRRPVLLEQPGRSRGQASRRAAGRAACRRSSASSSNDGAEREELTQRVPAQMVLAQELLDVLGRRAAGAGLEQPAALHQRDDRLHLRARPELEDREQVGEVVAQDVAGDRDRVLAAAGPLEREPRRRGDVEDLDLQAVGIELGERRADLGEQLGVVGACLVEPEDRRRSRSRARARRRAAPSPGSRASLVWHIRQMSPASTSCSISVSPAPSTTRTLPGPLISNVLSCEPYSSAACAIRPTFGVVPIVAGSKAPCSRQCSTVSA